MDYEDLLLEKKDGIATMTLNVPEKFNALTVKMRKSILLASEELAKDDEVRVVILTGAGRGFCSGADISGGGVRPEQSRYQRLEPVGPNFGAEAFCGIDKIVIAAINGACVGGGLSLALSCDIRIASETARFSAAIWVQRAIVPDCGCTYWLPKMVGTSKALELMCTGEMFDAAEAGRLGIVSRVVPPDELMKVARELATKIAKQPPISVELTKRIIYRSMVEGVSRQLDLESWALRLCAGTEDSTEARLAIQEKRPPVFKGK